MSHTLTAAPNPDDWRRAYRTALDDQPAPDIAWERDQWRRLGVPVLAALCHRALDDGAGADVPATADRRDLDALWRNVDQSAALALVRAEGMPLLVAARVLFWTRRRAA